MNALLWLVICSVLPAYGTSIEEAASLWEQGDSVQAETMWEALSQTPNASGIIHHNLGNALYVRGQTPFAISHWRLASQKRPRDGAVSHNLALVRSELEGVPPPVPAVQGWMHVVSPLELAWLGFLGVLAGCIVIMRGRRDTPMAMSYRRMWSSGLALLCGGGLLATVALGGDRARDQSPVGVVLEHTVVRELARADSQPHFTLEAGSEVRVYRHRGGFDLIITGDARRGWVPSSALIQVFSNHLQVAF